jgi:vacuolar iron transporter family protein
MTEKTAIAAAHDVHTDVRTATMVHVTRELGVDPTDKPSPRVAAVSSFVMFSAGAIASLFTVQPWWRNAIRQLLYGALAAGATYAVGLLIGG